MVASASPVRRVRLTTDHLGVSHFVDDEVPMEPRDVAPPAAPLDVSDAETAARLIFWRAPVGWDGRRHPAPVRQWVFVFEGAIEVTAGDGEARRLGPGDGLLLEDVTGDGHTTRVVGDGAALGMFVPVD